MGQCDRVAVHGGSGKSCTGRRVDDDVVVFLYDRFTSTGQYLYLRFTSSSYTPLSSNTGFSATISTAAVYYMSSSCPGPITVSSSMFTAISLTSSSTYSNYMDCSVVLYSGSSSQSVQLVFNTFSTGYNSDFLYIRDGSSSSSPLLSQMSGSYSYGQTYV